MRNKININHYTHVHCDFLHAANSRAAAFVIMYISECPGIRLRSSQKFISSLSFDHLKAQHDH